MSMFKVFVQTSTNNDMNEEKLKMIIEAILTKRHGNTVKVAIKKGTRSA